MICCCSYQFLFSSAFVENEIFFSFRGLFLSSQYVSTCEPQNRILKVERQNKDQIRPVLNLRIWLKKNEKKWKYSFIFGELVLPAGFCSI